MVSLRPARRVRAIVFDLGGVVVDWNPRHLYRKLFVDPAEMERFLEEIGFADWNHEQDRGRPFAEGVAELSRRFPHHAERIAAYHQRWDESITGPISGTIDILHELRAAGYPLAAITNWSAETFARVADLYGFRTWFDPLIVSGHEGICKPDPEIFRRLLGRGGWSAPDCVFIDDALANVRAASDLGFQAILFRSPEELRVALVARGVLPGGASGDGGA
jgi:2-haloacid dehalogenase